MLGVYDCDLLCSAGELEPWSLIDVGPSVSDLDTDKELLLRTWVRDVAGDPGRRLAERREKVSV